MDIVKYSLEGVEIFFGKDALTSLESICNLHSIQRLLIVTDAGIVASGIVKIVKDYLYMHQIAYEVYDGVKSDPLDTMVEEGLLLYRKNQCDAVLSLGGGSCMDTGKCISIMSVHEGHILDYARSTMNHKEFKSKGCPIISIPTTSGTGSEVSQYAVITNSVTHRKTTISTPLILSQAAILIPTFASTMSNDMTAYTGMDALAHAIEAYTHKDTIDHNVKISDICALEAIQLIGEFLKKAYQNPTDLEARSQMMWASLLAGIALNIGSGETHAIGSMLSKYYGVCHGISVGIPLPYCMEHNLPFSYERFRNIAKALGCDVTEKNIEEAAQMSVSAVKKLLEDIEFPRMSDFIKNQEDIRKFSEECANNSCCVSNQRIRTKEEIENIFEKALKG